MLHFFLFIPLILFFTSNSFSINHHCSLTKLNMIGKSSEENKNDTIPKKHISISPGGLLGFYSLGISTFIKENYDLTDFTFSGASAGAWNALFMCYKKNPQQLAIDLIDEIESNVKNLKHLEKNIKNKLLTNYKDRDFDLSKLKITLTTVGIRPRLKIISEFENLEDAIDCCISSSHIPFITGGIINKYKNITVIDGALFYNSFIKSIQPDLHITPDIWNNNQSFSLCDTIEESKNFEKKRIKISHLFLKGYEDAKKNKEFLDSILKK